MTTARLEINAVPDFSGQARLVFEARVLFLLASWLDLYGEGGSVPNAPLLRLCCVGEPPETVCCLAARAGAKISVHPPLEGLWGGFANKLRGLEDSNENPCLLLDADVMILRPLEWFNEVQSDFAAATAGKPRIPQPLWETIYRTLDLQLPQERVSPLCKRLGLSLQTAFYRYEGQEQEAEMGMMPYYNSGVLFVRRGDGELRHWWENHLRRIQRLAMECPQTAAIQGVMFCDQAGLATALQALRNQGRTFEALPDAYNVRLSHLRGAALRWSDVKLFHAAGFLRGLVERTDLRELLDRYKRRCSEAMMEGAQRDAEVNANAETPGVFLETLWQRHVRPMWEV